MLSMGGYSDHLVTDLASDMADGTTLLKLVQTVGESVPPRRTLPHSFRLYYLLQLMRYCPHIPPRLSSMLTN